VACVFGSITALMVATIRFTSSLAQEEVMSDRTVTAPLAPSPAATEATIAAYLESWNETDPARRQAAIARAWGAPACYRDPLMAGDGHAGIDAMLAAVQARFPGFVLKRISAVDAHNGPGETYARFA
jgi:hypothetical protein